ncbi:HlyD family secretion protein [Variovorax sp. J22P168]|uniref:HlyD family secretion protein n=1 Tax=Variovorax jilinensis TaxID=3053513 RepID=UPI0025761A56|nr:HlyD family secretion protein [Variovorax sp. J22P168]MDM0015784.1 HlyD family secretion protein [Variovorax sp. J22P168]
MSADPVKSTPSPSPSPSPAVTIDPPLTPQPPASGKGSRIGGLVVLLLIVLSLLWYFVSDRLTPTSAQARVQAFVVPVAAEVSGKVLKVHVRNNDEVQAGTALFEIDPTPYRIALQRSRSDYESVRLSVSASTASVDAARAGVRAALANHVYARQDAARLEQIYAEDPGAISLRRVESARANLVKAQSQVKSAEADLRRAQETAGEVGDGNAQLVSARLAIEKAELDLQRTRVLAPSRGAVTDLHTDVGYFVHAGAPVITLIASHDLWINADMTENNLGNIKPGDPVAIALDVMPGQVLKGRVRSVGSGVGSGQQTPPGSLPKVDNSRDWLRQAQRFPVAIEFGTGQEEAMRAVRIGGQAEVMVYTGDHSAMNWLGARYLGLMSYLSYLY